MSVTFRPSTVGFSPVQFQYASHVEGLVPGPIQRGKIGEIFQSSFVDGPKSWDRSPPDAIIDLSKVQVTSAGNGFVNSAVDAYNNHYHLVISPDDVWLSILLQFNLFVNAHAEELRHVFVAHEGKKELRIESSGTRHSVDFGHLAERMTQLIQANVLDPELRTWIIPDFSTTTANDRVVSSIVMMATMKAYFSYTFSLACGLPQVTLLGKKSDWEKILVKIDKLKTYGEQTQHWHSLLKPVLTRFVRAFDDPHSEANKMFWQQIAHRTGGGSGPTFLSGWITAFCYFDKDGRSMYSRGMPGNNQLSGNNQVSGPDPFYTCSREEAPLQLDDANYHRIDTKNIPPGFAQVDVKLEDNGQVILSVMVAGQLGIKVSKNGLIREKEFAGEGDTVQSAAGWFIAAKEDTKAGSMMKFVTQAYDVGRKVVSRVLSS
jgi:hypothetical protein